MKRIGRKWDRCLLEYSTSSHKNHIKSIREKLVAFDTKPDEEGRSNKQECLYCYYVGTDRIGGSAYTTTTCGICGKEVTFSSTNTDVLCKECGKEHDLCKHCGSDMQMRLRRKKEWPEARF